ncbi:hypothetical protein GGR56DRAFT_26448 [Xylariaceae sp. FL0804]|nr:hypothetical protein GGR56DRAFT_26448 [Xylariaceae sp. FL0804]
MSPGNFDSAPQTAVTSAALLLRFEKQTPRSDEHSSATTGKVGETLYRRPDMVLETGLQSSHLVSGSALSVGSLVCHWGGRGGTRPRLSACRAGPVSPALLCTAAAANGTGSSSTPELDGATALARPFSRHQTESAECFPAWPLVVVVVVKVVFAQTVPYRYPLPALVGSCTVSSHPSASGPRPSGTVTVASDHNRSYSCTALTGNADIPPLRPLLARGYTCTLWVSGASAYLVVQFGADWHRPRSSPGAASLRHRRTHFQCGAMYTHTCIQLVSARDRSPALDGQLLFSGFTTSGLPRGGLLTHWQRSPGRTTQPPPPPPPRHHFVVVSSTSGLLRADGAPFLPPLGSAVLGRCIDRAGPR